MSAGLYGSAGGVNRQIKKLYAPVGGVNREIKELWAVKDGVNRKIFSAYDCQAHNISSVVTINANGRVSGHATFSTTELFPAFYVKLDHAIAYEGFDILAQMAINASSFGWKISTDAAYSGWFAQGDVESSDVSFTVRSGYTGQTDTFYFLCQPNAGYTMVDTPNGAITIGGIQLNNVEII